MKVSELLGGLLDYWVARAVDIDGAKLELVASGGGQYCTIDRGSIVFDPSSNWAQGGPLMDKFHVSLHYFVSRKIWKAVIDIDASNGVKTEEFGECALLALCRAVVAWKFGEEVDEVVV